MKGSSNGATNGVKANGNHSAGQNGHSKANGTEKSLTRLLERSWPIADALKTGNTDSFFLWIGKCIAEVVEDGCRTFGLHADDALPLGITYSFPAEQDALAEAKVTAMGKGFDLPPNLELGSRITHAYEKVRVAQMPPIKVVAIANDSVSTLVSFIFNYDDAAASRRATMGLILGTGSNATIPIKLHRLHPRKQPHDVSVLPGEEAKDVKIAVNTEWSINGTAAPMRQMSVITPWDDELSSKTEKPGFQPLEYMTAGRYLGELGRIMLVDYMTNWLKMPQPTMPQKLLERHSLSTTFLSHFKPREPARLVATLNDEFPLDGKQTAVWTEHLADALYQIAKAIEVRAAGIVAAAVLALLTVGEEIPAKGKALHGAYRELGVGYTGGCIAHFQDYLVDCQGFIDELVRERLGADAPLKVAMSPCHDGGVTGAGILVAAALSSQTSHV